MTIDNEAKGGDPIQNIATANVTCQTLGLARVLAEVQGSASSMPLLRVDKSAIVLIKNSVLLGEGKHIDVKYHLVWESAKNSLIKVEFIRSEK
jgi:hypothetical protein